MVTVSIDVGLKNCGIFMINNKKVEIYKIDFSPYNIKNTVEKLDKIFNGKELKLILVERQLNKNFLMNKISHHLEMYFTLKHVGANFVFCCPKNKKIQKTDKYITRKKLAVEKAESFLCEFNCSLKDYKKKDDIADAVCQYLYYMEKE